MLQAEIGLHITGEITVGTGASLFRGIYNNLTKKSKKEMYVSLPKDRRHLRPMPRRMQRNRLLGHRGSVQTCRGQDVRLASLLPAIPVFFLFPV